MWKSILYVLGTAGIFYLAILYKSRALFIICGTAVLLPLLFFCVLLFVKRKLRLSLFFYSYPDEKTRVYPVGILVENPTGISLPKLRARIRMKNTASGKQKLVKVQGKIPARSETEISGRFKGPEFGMWQAECKSVRLFEWMDFWYLRLKVEEQKQVMIFPAVYEMSIRIGIRTRLFWSDAEQYHPQVSGDDPSETLRLREYQKGDRMNRIHWKLTAKNDELIVAEMGMPMGCNIVIFLDGEPNSMGKDESRVYWEVLHSIAQELLAQECAYYLVWRDRRYQELLCRKAVRKIEDLLDFWCEISPAAMEKGIDSQSYADAFPGDMYASRLVWNQNLELICNDRQAVCIKPEQVREQLMELELLL